MFKMLGAFGLQGCGAFVLLNLCLVILDYPALDSYPAPHVKKLRYPSRHHVYRDEDYSSYFVNSFGLVGKEPTSTEDKSIYRIAVFGDSLVEAFQVTPEEKFTELIEHMIIPPVGYKGIEVWNFGFSGDNTGNAYARWLYQAKPLGFELVVFTFNDTDVIENRPQDVTEPLGAFLVKQPTGQFQLDESRNEPQLSPLKLSLKAWFGRFFYSAYTLRNRVAQNVSDMQGRLTLARTRLLLSLGSTSASMQANTLAQRMPSRDMVNHTCAQLAYVREQISASNSEILLVGLPSGSAVLLEEVARDPFRHDAYIALADCLRSAGLPFLDAYPVMAAATSEARDPYSSWDPGAHFNVLGHRLLAEAVVSFMLKESIGTRLGAKD